MKHNSHKEKLISGLGGAIAILAAFWITRYFEVASHGKLLLIASMGASAVLLFATPTSPLSQPWNVIGGHVVSALIGVGIHKLIGDPIVAGAIAVGLSITTMQFLNCLHPPGGASSLIPIIGGQATESYGVLFAFFPVGLGALMMVLVAVVFYYPMKGQRYPQNYP